MQMNDKIDFTHTYYQKLLHTLQECGYNIITVEQYLRYSLIDDNDRIAILRHDIDRRLHKARVFADIEEKFNVKSTYYFRYYALNSPDIIQYVFDKGHEVGYHYEVMSRANGDPVRAYSLFYDDLASFRTLTPINTVCMHGAPLSKFNNLSFWDYYMTDDFNLLGEAFLSISGVDYFSDTGRNWSLDHKFRDFLPKANTMAHSRFIICTQDLIEYIQSETPLKLYILTHPERWSGNWAEWIMMSGIDGVVNLGKNLLSTIRE